MQPTPQNQQFRHRNTNQRNPAMNTTRKRLGMTAIGLAILGGLTLAAHAATVIWNGSVDDDWAEGGNWTGGTPGSGDTPLFTNQDTPGTSILDTNRTVSGLLVRNPDDNNAYGNISHALDLGSTGGATPVVQRLVVAGNVGVGQYVLANAAFNSKGISTLTVTNGTLQIGTSGTSRELNLGYRAPGNIGTPTRGELIVGSSTTTTTFDAYLSTVRVGASQGASGLLDLRNAGLIGNGQTGTFRATTLHMATSGHGNYFPAASQILFGTSLQSLEVTGNLTMGEAMQTAGYLGKFGTSGTAVLPDNVDIKLGVSTSSRATVSFATNWSSAAHLVAGSGGEFTGYLNTLTVATNPGWQYDNNTRNATGRLDVRNMSSVMLDVSGNTVIGQASYKVQNPAYGYVHLGPGTATFNNLTIGPTYGSGLLDLYGTATTVNGVLTLNATGEIKFNNGATLTLNSNSGQNLAGAVNGTGNLVKNGTGILTLAGVNTYTGDTVVNAGTLALVHASSSNTIAGSSVITVAAGATLDVSGLAQGFELAAGQTLKGSGTVTGDTTIALGATLAPGASPGVLDFANSNLTIDGTYVVEIGAYSAPNAPATFSQTINIGDLVIGEDSSLQANNWLSSWDRYSTGTWYPILQYTGSLDGTFASLSGVWDIDYAYSFDGGTWVAIQVPEPASAALLALAGLALLRRRRR